MKVLVLAATGGAGRLIVRFRPGERPFRRDALVCSEASADPPGVDRIEGDARCALTWSLLVKRAESPLLNAGPEAVPPMLRVDFSRVQEPVFAERFKPFKPQEEDLLI